MAMNQQPLSSEETIGVDIGDGDTRTLSRRIKGSTIDEQGYFTDRIHTIYSTCEYDRKMIQPGEVTYTDHIDGSLLCFRCARTCILCGHTFSPAHSFGDLCHRCALRWARICGILLVILGIVIAILAIT